MLDLEDRVNRVFNPDVRPLVLEAHRCYATGSTRAAIVLTWTAVCADLIHKAQILADENEPDARALVADVERAQQPAEPKAVSIMLEVEGAILETAEKLELIDRTQKTQLQRLREDRNVAAHPSLRLFGELYEPTPEYARAHLVAALDAVLIHPPSQGRTVVTSFCTHVADPNFTFDQQYLSYAFFDRVRPSVRSKVVGFAAKFALLQIADDRVTISPAELADRMGRCLRHFAERDADTVTQALKAHMDRLVEADPTVQLAALARLGNLPAFWGPLPGPLRTLFNTRLGAIGRSDQVGRLTPDEARALSLVTHPEIRASLPALEDAFAALHASHRAQVIGLRPDQYYTAHLPTLLTDVGGFDQGKYVARTAVLPCAALLSLSDLTDVLRAWYDNNQCWGRGMTRYLVDLYQDTAHLGPERDAIWRAFLEELRPYENPFNEIATGTGLLAPTAEPNSEDSSTARPAQTPVPAPE
ncbi:hypothetical protein AB0M28_20615 [Streptomyces sp. NPDC051940]|uniref:hypothetical protein n=1 Tax=Streptomyces sp. NPDC051940 TaxID=3155675 RepID=UPI0034241C7C